MAIQPLKGYSGSQEPARIRVEKSVEVLCVKKIVKRHVAEQKEQEPKRQNIYLRSKWLLNLEKMPLRALPLLSIELLELFRLLEGRMLSTMFPAPPRPTWYTAPSCIFRSRVD